MIWSIIGAVREASAIYWEVEAELRSVRAVTPSKGMLDEGEGRRSEMLETMPEFVDKRVCHCIGYGRPPCNRGVISGFHEAASFREACFEIGASLSLHSCLVGVRGC